MPPAGRFSTTTGWPRTCAARGAGTRGGISATSPRAPATTSRSRRGRDRPGILAAGPSPAIAAVGAAAGAAGEHSAAPRGGGRDLAGAGGAGGPRGAAAHTCPPPTHNAAALPGATPPYDPIRDFAGVANIGMQSYVLMASAAVPARTAAEFVEYARSNPGRLNYASAGHSGSAPPATTTFASRAKPDVVDIRAKT